MSGGRRRGLARDAKAWTAPAETYSTKHRPKSYAASGRATGESSRPWYRGPRCESGWTGDRCTFNLGHEGPHSNEEPDAPAGAGDDVEAYRG